VQCFWNRDVPFLRILRDRPGYGRRTRSRCARRWPDTAAINRGTMVTYEQAGALALAAVESLRPPDELLLAD
jgi:hypothetical protein